MVTGITERNKMKTELVGLGYSIQEIDEWPPKTTLYRHKPAYNTEGNVTDEVGTFVENVPGNPDYVLRKSRIGQFKFPPSDTCECKWCRERIAATEKELAELPTVDLMAKYPETVPTRDDNGKFTKKKK